MQIFWDGDEVKVVEADSRPFVARVYHADAELYSEEFVPIRFIGNDSKGRPRKATMRRTLTEEDVRELFQETPRPTILPKAGVQLKAYPVELWLERAAVAGTSFSTNVLEIMEDTEDKLDAIQLTDLKVAPTKLDDLKAEVQDPLLEVNLGTKQDPRPTYISLSRELVEHKLPIKEGFKSFKQPPRRMSQEVVLKVKEEIERLHKAGFRRTARYVDWISNIVPVVKKNGKLRVCVDFRNINLATPKDEYPMPVADQLVDSAAKNEILSFMDGHSRNNQIYIAKEDIAKTAFRCPGSIGTFEWVVMPFGLKNAGATYQRAMNAIFHDMIGHFLEVYIDDVVIKSSVKDQHLHNLKMAFERMRQHKLKMNPLKCAFGVSAGNFLGFLVHQRGIEIDQNKAKDAEEFKWTEQHQQAFEGLKSYLANPPVLMPPIKKRPLRLYLSAANESIRTLLAQNNEWGKEQSIYYLSRVLTPVEYLIKYMLSRPLITGRIGKWSLALMEFSFKYIPQKAVKGRAVAEFLADHPSTKIDSEICDEVDNLYLDYTPWTLMFDGSSTHNGAEYEALIIGLEILLELKVEKVQIIGDSNLILSQLSEEYRCLNWHLRPFHSLALELLCQFDDFQLKNWPRHLNTEADDLTQLASRVKVPPGVEEALITVKRTLPSVELWYEMASHFQPEELERIKPANKPWEVFNIDIDGLDLNDWRTPIIQFLQEPSSKVDKRIQLLAPHYILIDGDLYKKSKEDGLLLRCLRKDESMTPFRGWALDFIGKLRPPSSDGHTHIVVATDYFTKWVEAIPLKTCEQSTVIDFIKKHIIHRFGIPETITTDRGLSFVGSKVLDYCAECGVQAEASNKVILNILEKMIDDHSKEWHHLLSEALWAYRNSKRSSTGVTPYMLTYGHDAILPMEMTIRSARVAFQNRLTPAYYNHAMLAKLEDLDEVRLNALDHIIAQKKKVMRAYNKKVKAKTFIE
ncbi:uncharacterized protein LOC132313924 [Cornus florida]|uniref:uncharacterized protein LOC132313924 n=1 Tax=Cornus florida TaxID=4283 RepID=UPI002897C5BE|nr:uncharacterized protein LOC132313924 [Cornus florida]